MKDREVLSTFLRVSLEVRHSMVGLAPTPGDEQPGRRSSQATAKHVADMLSRIFSKPYQYVIKLSKGHLKSSTKSTKSR